MLLYSKSDNDVLKSSSNAGVSGNDKVQFRNIVNINSDTKDNKETVITTTDNNGNKVYYQGIAGTNGATVKGPRLIVDTRGLKQNEYYTVDDSIPNGAEVDKKILMTKKYLIIK